MDSGIPDESVTRGVPSWEAELRWSEIKPLIERALTRNNRGEYLPEDYLDGVKSGDLQFWAHGDPFITIAATTIIQYPRLKVCEIILCGGAKIEEWINFPDNVIAPWAKSQGCDEIRAGGREGWARAIGWERIYTICGKRL